MLEIRSETVLEKFALGATGGLGGSPIQSVSGSDSTASAGLLNGEGEFPGPSLQETHPKAWDFS